MTRFLYLLTSLRGSFWVVPGLMTAAAALLAVAAVWLDAGFLREIELRWARPLMVNAESASRILSAIAGSMITVASLVFSITLIALTLAASNIGPRLIERFMQDRVTQISLGVFIATFVYSLLVLRAVRGGEAATLVPHLAVNLALLFAILSFGWLVYFIHRISVSLQTNEVVARTGADFVRAIAMFAKEGREIASRTGRRSFDPDLVDGYSPCIEIPAGQAGYVQVINIGALLDVAMRDDLCIEMLMRPGHFVLPVTPIARVHSRGGAPADGVAEAMAKNVVIGPTRTDAQDVELLIHMVVEVAARALSPGVNDFYSAIACVDHLCSGLSVALEDDLPPNLFFDADGRLRVALMLVEFRDLADAAFNPIRQSAARSVPVSARLLEVLAMLRDCARDDGDRVVLSRHAALIAEAALDAATQETDRQDLRERYARFIALTKAAEAAANGGVLPLQR